MHKTQLLFKYTPGFMLVPHREARKVISIILARGVFCCSLDRKQLLSSQSTNSGERNVESINLTNTFLACWSFLVDFPLKKKRKKKTSLLMSLSVKYLYHRGKNASEQILLILKHGNHSTCIYSLMVNQKDVCTHPFLSFFLTFFLFYSLRVLKRSTSSNGCENTALLLSLSAAVFFSLLHFHSSAFSLHF